MLINNIIDLDRELFIRELQKMSITDIIELDTRIIGEKTELIKEYIINEIIKLPLHELLKLDEDIINNNINKDKQSLIRKVIYNKIYFFNHC